jgi:hypothetical protein
VSPSVSNIRGNANGNRFGFDASHRDESRRQNVTLRLAVGKKTSWPVFLFLTGLVVPWVIPVGPLRMSVYRIVLVVMILPCLRLWISGKAGRIRIADVALLLYCFWCALSFVVNNGTASIQSVGITVIETAGPYFLARCFIRDADDFYNMVQLQFRIVIFLMPFALLECLTGQDILLNLFAGIMATPENDAGETVRRGLTRVHLVFEHPILFGVYVSSIFALTHLVLGHQHSFFKRNLRAGIVGATTFSSLSAGPIIVIAVQGFLLLCSSSLATTKRGWTILIGLLVSIYTFVDLVANRSALDIVASFFVFDSDSYWFRKVIWDYGSASAMAHPLFGVGLNEWERPDWMPSSIDNFWLSTAVTHGLPATFAIVLAIFLIFLSVSFAKGLDEKLSAYRAGFLITIVGVLSVLFTVSLWDAALVMFFFILGAGVWIADVGARR